MWKLLRIPRYISDSIIISVRRSRVKTNATDFRLISSFMSLLIISLLIPPSASAAAPMSFESAVNYPAGMYPESVIAGDFNEDGIQALAVANTGTNDEIVRASCRERV